MWMFVVREPRPDAPDWTGRRLLAAMDAIVWPLIWVQAVAHIPAPVGLVGPFVVAASMFFALTRLYRALWMNHRYRFTTWRWGKVVGALLVIGALLKLTMTV